MSTTITIPAINLPTIAYALFISITYGLAGYADSVKTKNESFNKFMFLKTIIISLIVAGVLVYIGGDPTVNYTAALALVIGNPTLTAFVDTIVNDLLSLKGITIVVQSNPPTVPKPS